MRHRLKVTLTAALVITAACSDAAGPSGPPNTLRFTTAPETVRQGDPTSFVVEAFDDTGTLIEQAALSWSVEPLGAGDFPLGGRFVGYQPGLVDVTVSHGSLADTIAIEILARAVPAGSLRDPILVAEFRTPNTIGRPHNFWIDETQGILWLSWYQDGIYAVDATGELLGRLDRQGRTIMQADYSPGSTGCFDIVGNDTCAWAPQLHNGLLYVSDVNTGLWILRPEF